MITESKKSPEYNGRALTPKSSGDGSSFSIKAVLKKMVRPFYRLAVRVLQKKKVPLVPNKPVLSASAQVRKVPAKKKLFERIQEETCVTRLIAQTPDGLFCFSAKDTAVGWHIAHHETWERMETDFIKKLVKPGDCVLDIGANLGWYSVLFGNLVGEKGLVLAFEPEPFNFDLLTKNVALNHLGDCVKTFQLALLDVNGEISFELSPRNFGDHRPRFQQALQEERLEESFREEIKVPARTLDSLLADKGLSNMKYKLLKIDSQGCEVGIFRGAQRTLSHCEYMIAEFWPYGLNRAGATVEEWVDLVKLHFNEFSRLGLETPFYRPIEALAEDVCKEMDMQPKSLGYTNYVLRKK